MDSRASFRFCVKSHARRFASARRGAAAVEFALSGIALLGFLLAIINLGEIGLILEALQRGVEGAARQAAVAASVDVANQTACPNGAAVQQYFNSFITPAQFASGVVLSSANGTLALNSPWSTNDATLPGSYIVLTASYHWTPIGFSAFGPGLNLTLSGAAFVIGTTGVQTC